MSKAEMIANAIAKSSSVAVEGDDLTTQVRAILEERYKDNPTMLAEKLTKLSSVLMEDKNTPYIPVNDMETPVTYKTLNGLPSLTYAVKVKGRLCQIQFKTGIIQISDSALCEAIEADLTARPSLNSIFRKAVLSNEVAKYIKAQKDIENAKQAVTGGISSMQVSKVQDIQTLMGGNEFNLVGNVG